MVLPSSNLVQHGLLQIWMTALNSRSGVGCDGKYYRLFESSNLENVFLFTTAIFKNFKLTGEMLFNKYSYKP